MEIQSDDDNDYDDDDDDEDDDDKHDNEVTNLQPIRVTCTYV